MVISSLPPLSLSLLLPFSIVFDDNKQYQNSCVEETKKKIARNGNVF